MPLIIISCDLVILSSHIFYHPLMSLIILSWHLLVILSCHVFCPPLMSLIILSGHLFAILSYHPFRSSSCHHLMSLIILSCDLVILSGLLFCHLLMPFIILSCDPLIRLLPSSHIILLFSHMIRSSLTSKFVHPLTNVLLAFFFISSCSHSLKSSTKPLLSLPVQQYKTM